MLFLIFFCTDMAGEEDARERRIREGRVRKGKLDMTNSHRKELEVENLYVPKPRRCRDLRIGEETSGSQPHMDYSSLVVDLTQAHEYAGYAGGFEGYDQMEEEAMFYQPQEEAEDEEVVEDDEVAEDEDVEADYLAANDIVLEPEPRRQRRRAPLIPPCPVVGPPFPRGPETTHLLSDYMRHVAIPLCVNHHNVSVEILIKKN